MINKTIVVGITQGDINGISYEIIMKSLKDARMMELCCPIIYGSSKIASFHKNILAKSIDPNFKFNIIKQAKQATLKRPNLINVTEDEIKIDIGEITPIAGEMSRLALESATKDIMEEQIDVLVTCPINKQNVISDTFKFSGHTEYFASVTKTKKYLMLMVADTIRIGTITTHCALNEVSAIITKKLIAEKIEVLHHSLIKDFGIIKPRIAVLALNPHAGDNQLFGTEEHEKICPAIQEVFDKKIYAFGPFAADGFFGSGEFKKYDGILAMYHDQAMIPFKVLSFDEGVNFTAGLPFVRTSPAHGSAIDIAGKDIASYKSLSNAIYLACDIYKNRQNFNQPN
ncbi:MAG: 4-hydroxythreonine-4-phosphate dehydrogenase PdxA [Bacteroidales bacterium]|jgi:4-hydroxythreonine-4-phosphate dehydrogenase|nr:4-hydroxythreonine-4-phosphate dehydrogenase PdxA [Bacteroidales bacterium]MDD4209391.1 4-hydroxythreonine-4-phosphate dehydrogenase PdxA [Bacteroidales bacterium]MDY0015360.1 4-hydroxythreonine-4-phosphate dehydrogenase PdxA [Bacteroidales bacterium]